MCGIAGCITKEGNVVPFLIKALDVLMNRGYDGFGIFVEGSDAVKSGWKGFEEVKEIVDKKNIKGFAGITHNRFATHGTCSPQNSHPHTCGDITVVHNGEIDNFYELKEELVEKGYIFKSDTDTEVFAALVADERKNYNFLDSVKKALLKLGPTSTYAFLVMDSNSPGQIIATCNGSRPLIWATKDETTYIASEASALFGWVQNYQDVPEGYIALFEAGNVLSIENMEGKFKGKFKIHEIDTEHYVKPEKTSEFHMYIEMKDAPNVIRRAIGRRVTEDGIVLGGIGEKEIQQRLLKIKKFFVAGCGTSYYAGQIIAESLREIAGIEAEPIIASEAIYQTRIFDPETTALIVISQSGGTADVVRLMDEWKKRGILMLGIVNVPNTQIPKLTDAGIYIHAGEEVAVASTKAFLGEIICGIMFALSMGQQRGMSISKRDEYINELKLLSEKAEQVFACESQIIELAKKYANAINFLYMGRNNNSIVASEGALKLKEITWNENSGVHALGIPAGEMKHGTLAMIGRGFPTFVIAPNDSVFAPTMYNVSEVMAKLGPIILITNDSSNSLVVKNKITDVITIPKTLECMSPILSVIVLQLFAFYMAIERGCNPDMPRNLAKSITVE